MARPDRRRYARYVRGRYEQVVFARDQRLSQAVVSRFVEHWHWLGLDGDGHDWSGHNGEHHSHDDAGSVVAAVRVSWTSADAAATTTVQELDDLMLSDVMLSDVGNDSLAWLDIELTVHGLLSAIVWTLEETQ